MHTDAHGDPSAVSGRGEWWVVEEAVRLRGAERSRIPVVPLTVRRPGLDLADAYRVQAALVASRVAEGACMVGHKIGATSRAMQQQMGVDEPDSGVLLNDMLLTDDTELRSDDLLSPRVEAEIAFRLGQDLRGPNIGEDDARRAVSDVLLALEVIDTRFTDWRIELVDSVADNASCARVATGASVPFVPGWDLAAERLLLCINGETVAWGEGRAVLGDPIIPLVWLVRRLHTLGSGMRAGDLVLAGAVHASVPLRAGSALELTSPHLPPVHLKVC